MDRAARNGRNSQVQARTLPRDPQTAPIDPPPPDPVMVDVVVLSGDLALYEAIRHSVGERNPVWRARSAEESVDLLMTGRCGVLLIDMATVTTRPTTLVEQIVDQFPDVVVVVAGRREDESVLASLISDGLVYRFMHKPLSPKRAGMFLNAAIRSHVERREGRAGERLLPLARELRSRLDPRTWLFVGIGLVLFIALLTGVLVARYGKPLAAPTAAAGAAATPGTLTEPLADPVLSRARAALAAGRFESPPGRNALDLYGAVLLTRPDDPEARRGLETAITRVTEQAERAAANGDSSEARRLAKRVLAVDADHPGALAVVARLTFPARSVPPAPATTTPPALAAQPVAADATPAGAATQAVATTPGVPVTKLAVPVTKLDPARPAPPPPAPIPATPVRVQPDPLTPRVAGSGVLPTSPGSRPASRPPLTYKPPSSTGHPIAGYARSEPYVARTLTPTVPTVVSMEPLVQSRDLEPVATPGPTYPPEAFRARVEGWVEVEFTVTERGTTRDVEVVAAQPRGVFDAAAIAAVAEWKYRPRVVNGAAVAQRSSVTLRFNVED